MLREMRTRQLRYFSANARKLTLSASQGTTSLFPTLKNKRGKTMRSLPHIIISNCTHGLQGTIVTIRSTGFRCQVKSRCVAYTFLQREALGRRAESERNGKRTRDVEPLRTVGPENLGRRVENSDTRVCACRSTCEMRLRADGGSRQHARHTRRRAHDGGSLLCRHFTSMRERSNLCHSPEWTRGKSKIGWRSVRPSMRARPQCLRSSERCCGGLKNRLTASP